MHRLQHFLCLYVFVCIILYKCVCQHCIGQAQCVGWTQEVGRQACGPLPLGPQGSYHRWPTDISPGLGSAKTWRERESETHDILSLKGWKTNSEMEEAQRHFTFAQVRLLTVLWFEKLRVEKARKMVGLFHGITGETTCLHWPESTTFLAAFTLENQCATIKIHIKAIYGSDLSQVQVWRLIAYIYWLLLGRHKFFRQPCLNSPVRYGLKVKV